MAQGQRLNPAARDAAVRRITLLTTGVVALGLTGTVGLGAAIAAGIPVKADTSANAAYEEEVVVEDAPVATTEQAPPKPAGTGTAVGAGKTATTPTTPTQKKPVAPAPKPRVTTKAPQTQSGGS
ncbi:MAG: hypothetical protein ABW224_01890 [Kibdelosporangium sp.]